MESKIKAMLAAAGMLLAATLAIASVNKAVGFGELTGAAGAIGTFLAVVVALHTSRAESRARERNAAIESIATATALLNISNRVFEKYTEGVVAFGPPQHPKPTNPQQAIYLAQCFAGLAGALSQFQLAKLGHPGLINPVLALTEVTLLAKEAIESPMIAAQQHTFVQFTDARAIVDQARGEIAAIFAELGAVHKRLGLF